MTVVATTATPYTSTAVALVHTSGARPTLAAGDHLIAWVSHQGTINATGPAGWVMLDSTVNGSASTSLRTSLWFKPASAMASPLSGEPTTYTWNLSSSRHCAITIQKIAGAKPAQPPVAAVNGANGSSNNVTLSTFPVTAQGESLMIHCHHVGGTVTYTPRSPWIEDAEPISAGTTGGSAPAHQVIGHRTVSSAGVVASEVAFDRESTSTGTPYPGITALFLDNAVVEPPVVVLPTRSIVAKVGEPVSITATAPGATSWAWTKYDQNNKQTADSGIVVPTLTGASTATVGFTGTTQGSFTLKVVATNAGGASIALTTVNVMIAAADAPSTQVIRGGAWVPFTGRLRALVG